jgi:hypothetical protein
MREKRTRNGKVLTVNNEQVIAGLESIGMGEGLQTEIRKALEQFGDQVRPSAASIYRTAQGAALTHAD